eukprot:280628_1
MSPMDNLYAFFDEIGNSEAFEFSKAPLSSWKAPVLGVLGYFVLVRVCSKIAKNRKTRLDLNLFAAVHSGFLSVASMCLLLSMFCQLVMNYYEADRNLLEVFIDSESRWKTGNLAFLYYINYLSKYYELIDTALIALKGKPVIFLHWYHHAATIFMTWSQLYSYGGAQWVFIMANLFVHVFMYAYYTLSALRVRCWWKRYITSLQIFQFVIDFVIVWGIFLVQIMCDLGFLPGFIRPSGEYGAMFYGAFMVTSYLILFTQFYKTTYKKSEKKSYKKSEKKLYKKSVCVSEPAVVFKNVPDCAGSQVKHRRKNE